MIAILDIYTIARLKNYTDFWNVKSNFMRYIYTAFIFAVLLVSCKDKPALDRTKTDWEFYKLKGDVKSVSEKTEVTGQGKGAASRESEYDADYTFNENGVLVSEKNTFPVISCFRKLPITAKIK